MEKDRSRQSLLKIAIFGFVLLLIVSALTWHIGVSASTAKQEIGATSQDVRFDSKLEPQAEKVRQIIESPAFAEFDAWVKQYSAGNLRADSEQIKRGEDLAVKRRELFKQLIKLAPQAAIEHAISVETYDHLPASISKQLERRVSAYGDLLVYVLDGVDPATGQMTSSRTERQVVIGDARYEAFVYGRREAMTTKLNIPLQGIILDGWIAVDENPLRKLEPKEYESHAVDSAGLNEFSVVAKVGGELVAFSNQAALESFVREQIEWESKIGPVRPDGNNQPLSSYTEGLKTVLVIRVDFPDRPGEPIDSSSNLPFTEARALSLMNNEVNPFFVNNSYNKTSMQTTVTPVVRLPQTQAYYAQGTNYNALFTDARNAARAAGFETNNFNLDIVAFSNSQLFSFAGLSYVGGKGMLINGSFDFAVFSHELGHNYGLNHANLWRTIDGTVIGQGNDVDGRDFYDRMGERNGVQYHFNARYKRYLDWLTDANVQNVTDNGIYRIFAQDSSTPGGIRVLKIKKDETKSYWVEFRQLITNNPNIMNGATVRWDKSNSNQTQLLDMSPGTASTQDAPLLIGQSFNDNENRIRITVLGKGNTTPESLDVRVELNIGCSFSLGQTSQSFTPSGGEGSIIINTQSGCSPVITSNDSWISVVSNNSSTVNYIVAANYDSQSRTGTITVSGQTFTIQQSATTTACNAPPSGLVAWWRGEGNALDQTGVNNGNVLSGMSYSAGKIGGGFRGMASNPASNNRILVPDSPALALDRSLAIEGWLRFDSIANYTILVRGDDRDYAGSYGIFLFSGRLWFRVFATPNGTSAVVISPNVLPTNQFIHFAATLDDATGQMKLYIDGSLAAQTVTTVRPYGTLDLTKTPRIALGNLAHSNLTYGSFNGFIDELTIYNRALSASEIRAIYDTGTAATGATGKCLSPSDGNPGTVQFSASNYNVGEAAIAANVIVTRTGDTSGSATVTYATVDDPASVRCDTINGTAYARCDYATTVDTLIFAPGETQKTFTIPIIDDVYVEGAETVQLRLSNPSGATLGAQSTATLIINDNDTTGGAVNPILTTPFFVRMQYLDFLSREPEAGEPWSGVLQHCPNVSNLDPTSPSAGCDRLSVSSSFFGSPEFQLKGFYVFLFYKVAFNRLAEYSELIPDMRAVTGATAAEVFQKRAAFATAFAQRAEFRNAYDGLSNSAYVSALLARYNLTSITTPDPAQPDETQKVTLTQAALVSQLTAGTLTRAQVLRAIVQSDEVNGREYNGTFVAMQYYGYLRRMPEAGGYQSWLTYLNAHPSDFRTMVNGFMNSTEYRLRFGQP